MSFIPLDQLITPVTTDQQLESFLAMLETVGVKARSWREGGSLRTILRILAGVCATFSELQVRFIKSGFLEYAEGQWLTWLAYYVFGVTRREETFAVGKATLTNTGGGLYTWNAGELRILNSTTGKSYTNDASVTLNPSSTVTFDITAVERGTASNASTGQIDTLESVYVGVTVTNADPVAGSDAQTDDDLRQECKDKLGTLSKFGPRGAYAYAVRTAKRTNGTIVDINRFSVSPSSSTGIVTIYIAAPSGAPASGDVTAVSDNIEAIARPDTVTVDLNPAVALPVSLALTVWAKRQDGLSASDIEAACATAIVNLSRTYPIGGIKKSTSSRYLYSTTIEGAVTSAHPAIYAVDGAGSDVLMSANQVAVIAATFTVHLVDAEVIAA